jgi:predicted RNA methylase
MHSIFLYISGANFTNHRRIEIDDDPAFTLLEITSLLGACFPGIEVPIKYAMHRIVEVEIPALNPGIVQFLQRAVSIQHVGTPDCNFTASTENVDQAINEFTIALPGLEALKQAMRAFKGHATSFAINQTVHAIPLPKDADIAIKASLGAAIRAECGLHVDLDSPDVSATTFITMSREAPKKVVFIVSFHCTSFHARGFDDRLAKNRPAFEIGTMNPPLTSLMVNAAHPPRGHPGLVFDPFCGTGGILIEAQARGMASIGMDVVYECTKGCKRNLKFFNQGRPAGWHVIHASVFQLPIRNTTTSATRTSNDDVVVTDPPYGRLESLKQVPFQQYIMTLLAIARGYQALCFAIPELAADEVVRLVQDTGEFSIVSIQKKREHAGFSRAIILAKKRK